MNARHAGPEDYRRAEYLSWPGTQKGIMEFLGSQAADWSHMEDIQHEFLAIANRPKMRREDKQSPATAIAPEEFADFLSEYNGEVELHASLWQKESDERPGYPCRSLQLWDIDLYDNSAPNWPVEHPEEAFALLEPVYQLMRHKLTEYGIPHLAVVSGRGYNFVSQVPDTSQVMDEMLKIGGPLEATVSGKQAYPEASSKRTKPVPPLTELSHVASARLQQFLFGQIVNRARDQSVTAIEISDKGERGIAFDNTAMVYSIENRTFGVLGSPYFIKPESVDTEHSQTVIKIPRAGEGFELNLEDVMRIRSQYGEASELLAEVDCSIPDASNGIGRLMGAYQDSDIKKLHEALDSSLGDHPARFEDTYRKYDVIADQTSRPALIRNLIAHANDELLKPDNLDVFVWEIFNAWGGSKDRLTVASHVAGVLRSVYEDPQLGWGTQWTKKTDALRYARGWVAIILGQAFDK